MSHARTLTFQFTTHYLPKIALRVEALVQHIQNAVDESHPAIHQSALIHVLELSKLIEKPELKSRFLKELMRLEYAYQKSTSLLPKKLLEALQQQIHLLSHITGRFGEKCHHDPLLQTIRLTQNTHHRDIDLDSPPLLFWLTKPASQRQRDLKAWLEYLHTVYETSQLYLSMLRNSSDFETVTIQHGFYQKALSSKQVCYLVLLKIQTNLGLIPKIQLGHHGLNIRLCEAASMKEVTHSDVNFDLAVCQLL